MSRRDAREVALKALFQCDVGRIAPELALRGVLEDVRLSPRLEAFARQLVHTTLQHLPEIDSLIARFAVDWTLERMANIDRNLLRLAICEILYIDDVPAGVAANEAVELAKRYGDAESSKFVNGILGNVIRSLART